MYLYAKYCPVASAVGVVGDFWTPLIIRELLYGNGQFNQLARNLPGISRTVLSGRLRALERPNVVDRAEAASGKSARYTLTAAGRDLEPVIIALGSWGQRWGTPDADASTIDPLVSICMLKSRIQGSLLPPQRVVIEAVSDGSPRPMRAWLVCERQQVSMCFDPPGFDNDLHLHSNVETLYAVWLQHLSIPQAIAAGRLSLDGAKAIVSEFPKWFGA